ncbi:MAG: UDP-N-acetylmuramoyl-tripeptide--D-alanyl-D-alanine ligase [Anaerolineae bacterium]|nr:UDP-N-acetylmuramoyl-tripeptide--D-alanyl-D-alanine ligase [Anaerolineae bacterium]
MLTLTHVLTALTADLHSSYATLPGAISKMQIGEVVIDSRAVKPGALFVALPGRYVDGHQFVGDAFARGAIAAIVERAPAFSAPIVDLTTPLTDTDIKTLLGGMPVCLRVDDAVAALGELGAYWRARFTPRVIAVTGSVGKTSTKELIASVLARRYATLKSPESYNNEQGQPLTLLMLRPEHERLVLEMGMYGVGEIAALCRVARPDVGVVTMVAPVHLERVGSMEKIIQAKSELVEALRPEGVAILNADDANVLGMRDKTRARVVTYGLARGADFRATHIYSQGLSGISFRLHYRGETFRVKVPLLGRHSAHTALRAAAAAHVEGMTWDEILAGLRYSSAQLRLVAVNGPGGSVLLDDTYNASPDSTIAALNLLSDLDGRKVAVLGDMLELGSYEKAAHEKVGARAAEVVDLLVTVGKRGRLIAKAARAAGMSAANVHAFDTHKWALDFLMEQVGAGDVVLVKGSRAVEMEKIVAAMSRE